MKKLLFLLLVSFSAVVVPSANSPAQLTSEEGIHGMGEVVLERKPELMRLQVNLLAKGKDLPDAITKKESANAPWRTITSPFSNSRHAACAPMLAS